MGSFHRTATAECALSSGNTARRRVLTRRTLFHEGQAARHSIACKPRTARWGNIIVKRFIGILLALFCVVATAGSAAAQGAFPVRPIRIVIGFRPRGAPRITL